MPLTCVHSFGLHTAESVLLIMEVTNVYTMCSHYQEGALQDLDTTTSPRLSKLELLLEFLHTEAEILLLGYVGQ